ncbi:hypothetical protein LR48_Vigan08g051900 [Vigna angularis]|uniref:Uncharacterized protein n=1 Tax=Phaseolus angularis TaxID=3914 RepID=A0A0L9V425_PHAAN|nr:hypothetical protein LR48_Vigan08g051900 [Vigna angularis]
MDADEDEKDQHLLMDADEEDLYLLMDVMEAYPCLNDLALQMQRMKHSIGAVDEIHQSGCNSNWILIKQNPCLIPAHPARCVLPSKSANIHVENAGACRKHLLCFLAPLLGSFLDGSIIFSKIY